MKEINRQLLEELILGEREWKDPAVVRAIAEDPEFAKAAQTAAGTLRVLERNATRLDDVDMDSLPVTDRDRVAAHESLLPRTRSPILRHSLWLIPSAAAAVLVFSQMQKEPSPAPTPHNATLGGEQNNAALPQTSNGFKSFDLHNSIREGETARLLVYASDMESDLLFKTPRTEEGLLHLSADNLAKLSDREEVWVVIEFRHRGGHVRMHVGQPWKR